MDTLRVFVAIELTDDVKQVVADAIDSLRRERIDNLRLVRPEGVHLTLKFLGDIGVDRVPGCRRRDGAGGCRVFLGAPIE